MLKNAKKLVPTLPVTDLDRSAKFYAEKLGLDEAGRDQNDGGIDYGTSTWTLHIYPKSDVTATGNTMAAFEVDDIDATIEDLKSRGTSFETFDMPGATWEDDVAVFGEDKAVWVKDPDGHLLAITNSSTA